MILSCYTIGVTKGNWKDYSINYKKNEACFFIYKHTLANPEYALIKYKKNKKNKYYYQLKSNLKNNRDIENFEELISILKRKNINMLK